MYLFYKYLGMQGKSIRLVCTRHNHNHKVLHNVLQTMCKPWKVRVSTFCRKPGQGVFVLHLSPFSTDYHLPERLWLGLMGKWGFSAGGCPHAGLQAQWSVVGFWQGYLLGRYSTYLSARRYLWPHLRVPFPGTEVLCLIPKYLLNK